MPALSPRMVRFSALCGMAAPLLFGLTVGILGYLTPGYNPAAQLMSELGEAGAPFAWVMNLAGFAGTGLLMVLFSPGLREGLDRSRAGTAGAFLTAGAGMSFIAMAFFSCDRGCVPVSPAGEIHLLLGLLALVLGLLAAFAVGVSLRDRAGERPFSGYSFLTGLLVLVTLPVFLSAGDWAGAWQRILVGLLLLWMEVMALRLYLLAREGG